MGVLFLDMSNTDLLKRTRSTPKEKFLIVQNDVVQNKTLSFKAKGFLCYILSLPDDWILHKSYVIKEFGIGRDALNSIFKELEKAGYLVITDMITDESGRFKGKNYLFYDEPLAIKGIDTDAGFPSTVDPSTANQHLQSTNTNKVLIQQKDEQTDFEDVWSLYPRKKDKAIARKYYNAKARELERADIKKAVINYSEMVAHEKTEEKYIKAGRSFFSNEGWRDYVPTEQQVAEKQMPVIVESEGITPSRVEELWITAQKQRNPLEFFKTLCYAEKSYNK